MARESKEVKCPFYKDETVESIRCEGTVSVACKLKTEAIELYEKLGMDLICCTYSNELNRRMKQPDNKFS